MPTGSASARPTRGAADSALAFPVWQPGQQKWAATGGTASRARPSGGKRGQRQGTHRDRRVRRAAL